MLTALASGLGGQVATGWNSVLRSPAMAFWLGGLLAWVSANGGLFEDGWASLADQFGSTWTNLGGVGQAVAAVLALLLVGASGSVGERLNLPLLRLLEGYWPPWASWLREALTRSRSRRLDARTARWRELASQQTARTRSEQVEYTRLEWQRRGTPVDPTDRMPTRFGDVLAAMESRPRHWYGLDAATCWPRLWLLMTEESRAQVSAARSRLDSVAQVWLWSLLFGGWIVVSWWALPVALAGMWISYRLLLAAAGSYAALVQSSFDVFRRDLYAALDIERPTEPAEERALGQRITTALSRGPTSALPRAKPNESP